MSFLRCLFLSLVLLAPSLVHAAILEIPGTGTTLSGIGVISGWKCEANGPLTVSFDGGDPIPLPYGSKRPDVLAAGACASAEVGFVAIWNWWNLDAGEHTAVAYDDGVEFSRSTFTVVRASEEIPFLTGVTAECTVLDFPEWGTNARFEWNTGTQHLELAEVYEGLLVLPVSTEFDGRWDFTLELTHDLFGNCGCYREQQRGGSFYVEAGYIENDAGDTECATGVEQPTWFGIVSPYGELEGSASTDQQEASDPFFTFSWSGFLQEDSTGNGSWFNTAGCSGQWTATWAEDD